MAHKIRTFEKAKSKSASPKKKIKDISINSSYRAMDEFLKERYGYGIWHFIYSLFWVAYLYGAYDLGKEIALLKDKERKLRSAKTRLIENIDQFLCDTDLWKIFKRSYPDLNIKWTPDKREKFIARNFNVDQFFKIVDEYTERVNNRIKYLEIYTRLPGRKLRITARNLIILIWSQIMVEEGNEEKIDFENISVLLNWFSLNKNWAGFFKSTKLVSPKTPELTYNKYIKFSKNEEYHNISNHFYVTCFPDIAEPLTQIFPDPFDLIKQEIESIKIMVEIEFEKAIKKPVF